MIGLDTNILVRIYCVDDQEQMKYVQQLLSDTTEHAFFIALTVLIEFVWVLRVNKIKKTHVCSILQEICDDTRYYIHQEHIVRTALELYREGKADFSDYVILAENTLHSVTRIETFDKSFKDEIHQIYTTPLN